jgi:hypothetical protein
MPALCIDVIGALEADWLAAVIKHTGAATERALLHKNLLSTKCNSTGGLCGIQVKSYVCGNSAENRWKCA